MADLADLSGKTVLITGATQGIGLVTAVTLARLNANVVLVARDRGRGDAALAQAKATGGKGTVEVLQADLASQQSIRGMVEAFRARHDRLHVLVNNAGAIFFGPRQVTSEGLERTFAVNHLAYFLITQLLIDRLRAGGSARIVNVSSEAHRGGRLDFDDLQGERRYSAWRAYGTSKLCNLLFTRELARRLGGTDVTANAVHPGAIASGFGRNGGSFSRFFFKLGAPFLLTPEKGARTQLYLAASPAAQGISGEYFSNLKPRRPNAAARDDASAKRLWEISETLTGEHRIPEPARSAA